SLGICGDYKAIDGTPMVEGLNVIDLTDNTVYTYQDATAESPAAPLGGEPDSAAVDPTTGLVIVPSEEGEYQNILDFSQAKFDAATKTVTAPHKYIKDQGFTGVAVEPNAHYGFWEEEGSEDVGVVNINEANAGSGAFVHASMPSVPGGGS